MIELRNAEIKFVAKLKINTLMIVLLKPEFDASLI